MSLADPRARRVTYEQAVLDLEVHRYIAENGREKRERDEFFAAAAAEEAALTDTTPLHVPGAPTVAAGNTDKEAAMARLMAITGQVPTFDPDGEYEIVNITGEETNGERN